MNRYISMVVVFCFCSIFSFAQSDSLGLKAKNIQYYPKGGRAVGLNMTPLLTHLMPFNRASAKNAGPYMVRYRSMKRRNGTAGLRMAIGAFGDLNLDTNDEAFHFQIGYGRRKSFFGRWAYTTGFDGFLSGGSFQLDGTPTTDSDIIGAAIGVGIPAGIEFAIAPRITLHTETELFIGIGGDGDFGLFYLPPVALFLNYYIGK